VNLLLAVNEARNGIERGLEYFTKGDNLEFNASSDTPVMKSAWTVLQAAGYAPHSSVWQVRNPKQIQTGQTRVFETNVDTLKREFDVKVIANHGNGCPGRNSDATYSACNTDYGKRLELETGNEPTNCKS
jgi:hypothetical protein